MAEHEFDSRLERMFATAPACNDADAFARKVEARLDRNWRVRTLGIGSAGAVGGLIAVTQVLHSGFGFRIQQASSVSTEAVGSAFQQVLTHSEALLPSGMGVGMFLVASAIMVVVAVAAATRIFDEV
jgi:hypothetical protein